MPSPYGENGAPVLRRRGARRNLTFREKLAIIAKKEQEPSWPQRVLAMWAKETFRLESTPTQASISNMLRDKDKLRRSEAHPDFRAVRSVKHPGLDRRLAAWAHEQLEAGVRVTNLIIRARAVELASEMQLPPGMAFSKGWAACFMNRHHVPFPGRRKPGEAAQEVARLATGDNAVEKEQEEVQEQELVQETEEEEMEVEEMEDNSVDAEELEEEFEEEQHSQETTPPSTIMTEDPSRQAERHGGDDIPGYDHGAWELSEQDKMTPPSTTMTEEQQRMDDTASHDSGAWEPSYHGETTPPSTPVLIRKPSLRQTVQQRRVDISERGSGAWKLSEQGEETTTTSTLLVTEDASLRHTEQRRSIDTSRNSRGGEPSKQCEMTTATSTTDVTEDPLPRQQMKRRRVDSTRNDSDVWEPTLKSQEGRAAAELLLDWIAVPGSYSRWWLLKSDAEKEPLCDEINLFMRSHGLRGMNSAEIRMQMTTFVTTFQAAHTWLRQARVEYPLRAEMLTLEQEGVKSHVRQMCPHYERLVSVLAAYVDYDDSAAVAPRKELPPATTTTALTNADTALITHARDTSVVAHTPPKKVGTSPNPTKKSRRQSTESNTSDSMDDETKAQKRHLFELECERLQSEIETRNIQLVLEKTLARKKLLDAGISAEEVNRIFPL